jgi:hypothetical protein
MCSSIGEAPGKLFNDFLENKIVLAPITSSSFTAEDAVEHEPDAFQTVTVCSILERGKALSKLSWRVNFPLTMTVLRQKKY